MSINKTPIEHYEGEGITLSVEKWFMACADSEMESYTGVAFVLPDEKVVLLSKARTLKLIAGLKKAIGAA